MKLRIRIVMFTCMTVYLAVCVSCVIIFIISFHSRKVETFQSAFNEYTTKAERISDALRKYNSYSAEQLNYIFKSMEDDYLICFHQGKSVYNHTKLTYDYLSKVRFNIYTISDTETNHNRIEYKYIKKYGSRYILFKNNLNKDITYYKLYQISYLYDNMRELAVKMVIITILVTSFFVIFINLVLKKMFSPLDALGISANKISNGFYSERIEIKRKDEVGKLSENFNHMADRIESHMNALKESEHKKTIFMGNLTHELKTPMTAISGYAKTLLTVRLSEEDKEAALMYIDYECNRLERLSRKMMTLLEMETDSELDMKYTSAAKLFENVLNSCGTLLKDNQIELITTENGEEFYCDEDLMTDVLINLVDNAVKATLDTAGNPSEKINTENKKIDLTAGTDTAGIYMEVKDYGKGIEKEDINKITEPFYMVDKSRSRRSGGAGLGLSLVCMIIKRHNAQLTIDSEVGKGSRFKIIFHY